MMFDAPYLCNILYDCSFVLCYELSFLMCCMDESVNTMISFILFYCVFFGGGES
jgi:hypothetical protein